MFGAARGKISLRLIAQCREFRCAKVFYGSSAGKARDGNSTDERVAEGTEKESRVKGSESRAKGSESKGKFQRHSTAYLMGRCQQRLVRLSPTLRSRVLAVISRHPRRQLRSDVSLLREAVHSLAYTAMSYRTGQRVLERVVERAREERERRDAQREAQREFVAAQAAAESGENDAALDSNLYGDRARALERRRERRYMDGAMAAGDRQARATATSPNAANSYTPLVLEYGPREAAASVAFQLPFAYAAAVRVFSELRARFGPAFAPRRVLDFGCGPGTVAWALRDVFHPEEAETEKSANEKEKSEAEKSLSEKNAIVNASEKSVFENMSIVGVDLSEAMVAMANTLNRGPRKCLAATKAGLMCGRKRKDNAWRGVPEFSGLQHG